MTGGTETGEDAAAKRIAAKYADTQTAQFAINDFRDWQEYHAIYERVTLAAAQAMFPMRTVEVRPTDAEDVACGVCRAAVGEPCRVLLDPRYTHNPHAARRAAAAGLPFDPEGAQ